MAATRQQIIDLINLYIYTNGNQMITAAQLKGILLAIADSFEMEGGGGAGIDAVLAAGSSVLDGRMITNSHGGKLLLSSNYVNEDGTVGQYLGFSSTQPTQQGSMAISHNVTNSGNVLSPGNRNLFTVLLNGPQAGEVIATTTHYTSPTGNLDDQLNDAEPGPSTPPASPGTRDDDGLGGKGGDEIGTNAAAPAPTANGAVRSAVASSTAESVHVIKLGVIKSEVTGTDKMGTDFYTLRTHTDLQIEDTAYIDGQTSTSRQSASGFQQILGSDGLGSDQSQRTGGILSNVYSGPQSTSHEQSSTYISAGAIDSSYHFYSILNSRNNTWNNGSLDIARIDTDGLALLSSKRLSLTTGGATATAGLAILNDGQVTISTTAVRSSSVISLTVQETGSFVGNIRVKTKTPGTGFVIGSTNSTDKCTVFWQIIDLL